MDYMGTSENMVPAWGNDQVNRLEKDDTPN